MKSQVVEVADRGAPAGLDRCGPQGREGQGVIRVVWSMDDTPAGIVHSARLLGVEIGRVVRGEDGRYRWRMAGEGSWGGYRRGLGTLGNAKQAVTKAWMELRTGDGRLPSRPDPDKAP